MCTCFIEILTYKAWCVLVLSSDSETGGHDLTKGGYNINKGGEERFRVKLATKIQAPQRPEVLVSNNNPFHARHHILSGVFVQYYAVYSNFSNIMSVELNS